MASGLATQNNVHIGQALKTLQFWQLSVMLCFNVTAGSVMIVVAKTTMAESSGLHCR